MAPNEAHKWGASMRRFNGALRSAGVPVEVME